MSFDLRDSPNDRVLNMLQSLEPLILNYIKSNPEDKELAEKALSNLRKALAGDYEKLPEPQAKKKSAPVKQGEGEPYLWRGEVPGTYQTINYLAAAQQAQQQANEQLQMQQAALPTWQWPWER